jgi:quercetin 2,3-dioxygenase
MNLPLYEVRRSGGTLANAWLKARFSFSFGPYSDPEWDDFGPLAALNEDIVQPQTGFAMHPHRDLDIFMIPWRGAIAHEDSLGNSLHIKPGQVLRMTAGTGIRHSQMNPSPTDLDHHFQVWLRPPRLGLAPGIELREFSWPQPGEWTCMGTPDGTSGSFALGQPVELSLACVSPRVPVELLLAGGSSAYLHVLEGECCVDLGGARERLAAGQALVVYECTDPVAIFGARTEARLLLVRVPSSRVLRNRTNAETRAGR